MWKVTKSLSHADANAGVTTKVGSCARRARSTNDCTAVTASSMRLIFWQMPASTSTSNNALRSFADVANPPGTNGSGTRFIPVRYATSAVRPRSRSRLLRCSMSA
ncbi:hypothetical protein D3C72_1091250 [compost metagenome]